MRKVQIPDGRVKILFQGLARGKIVETLQSEEESFNRCMIDVVELDAYNKLKADALMGILRDKVKKLSSLNSQIPADLVRTIEENDEPNRIADLVSSMW